MFSPFRHTRIPKSESFISFTSYPAECTQEEKYKGPLNTPINVLLPYCKDISISLQNLPVEADQKVDRINALSPSVLLLSRNILYLTIISDEKFNPNNIEDILYLWKIWFNMKWSEKTKERFLKDVNKLSHSSFSNGIVLNTEKELNVLKVVWEKWNLFLNTCDAKLKDEIEAQRCRTVFKNVMKIVDTEFATLIQTKQNNLLALWEWLWTHARAHEEVFKGKSDHRDELLFNEMKSHFVTGNSYEEEETPYLNPMFIDIENRNWSLSSLISPYDGFLLNDRLSLIKHGEDDVPPYLRLLSHRILRQQTRFQNTLFQLSCENQFDFCYRLGNAHFDVIDLTGQPTFTDDFGMSNVLNASWLVLSSSNSHAILVTEFSPWFNGHAKCLTAKEYIEEALNAPLSMLPTLYGFILRNHVMLGNPIPPQDYNRTTVKLVWKKAMPYINVMLKSQSFDGFISKLQNKCFASTSNEFSCTNSYTPFSYAYITQSLAARIPLSDPKKLLLPKHEVPDAYRLAWETINAWMNGEEVLRVEICTDLQNKNNGMLKLVLMNEVLTCAQHFDNFCLTRTSDCIKADFLLISNHLLDLEKTFIYLGSGTPVSSINPPHSLNEAKISVFKEKFPFKQFEFTNHPVLLCHESEIAYCVELGSVNQENLKVSADLNHTSEAGHEIQLSAPEMEMKMSFPWPFKISEVHSFEESECEPLRLVLPKALYEPHPFEWDENVKWNMTSLDKWDIVKLAKDLNFHLNAQFQYSDLKRQIMEQLESEHVSNGLKGTKEVIRTLFQSAVLDGQQWFVVESKHDSKMKNLWFLRAHLPVRVSPWGSPMLLITANDHRLAQKLVDRGLLDQSVAAEDFKKFFVEGADTSAVASIFIQSDEEERILRYLLRLNSTKIDLSTWPLENLPSGKLSPWLATFVSPCYADFAGTEDEMNELLIMTDSLGIRDKETEKIEMAKLEPVEICSHCSKIGDLKRCSRCKSVKYCSIECQRSDWGTHKSLCVQTTTNPVPFC